MSKEVWKDIPGHEGFYQASNLGRVRSLRILNPTLSTGTGYPSVVLGGWKSSRYAKQAHVHFLVALTFLGPRPAGLEVNHKDGKRDNNVIENLEYITHGENVRHGLKRRGVSLSPAQLARIEELYYTNGMSCLAVARELGITGDKVRSAIRSWLGPTGPRKNPYKRRLNHTIAKEIRRLYKTGEYTQLDLSKKFGVNGGHISRVINNFVWPDARSQ